MKQVHFRYTDARKGVTKTKTISFKRFGRVKTRIFYATPTLTHDMGVKVNRLGNVTAVFIQERTRLW